MIRLVAIDRLGHRKIAFSKLPKGANKGIPLPYREPRESKSREPKMAKPLLLAMVDMICDTNGVSPQTNKHTHRNTNKQTHKHKQTNKQTHTHTSSRICMSKEMKKMPHLFHTNKRLLYLSELLVKFNSCWSARWIIIDTPNCQLSSWMIFTQESDIVTTTLQFRCGYMTTIRGDEN